MRWITFSAVLLTLTGLLPQVPFLHPVVAWGAKPGWVDPFNGRNLDGWYSYFNSTDRNHDPKKVFKEERGVIHVLDIPVAGEKQEFGYIAIEREFFNCRIHAEYKWGAKLLPPRAEGPRDDGFAVPDWIVGPDKVWPRTVGCQIQEGDTGDTWLVDGVSTNRTVSA